ncbi:uncharacterized protein VTP21DRAFT_7203 [Calcarisporiella thermophila]|uniref:uncharacterized protein n=1 Tax=Calcarisporiella thermophila TaxID=911321 RepID=UPI0037435092
MIRFLVDRAQTKRELRFRKYFAENKQYQIQQWEQQQLQSSNYEELPAMLPVSADNSRSGESLSENWQTIHNDERSVGNPGTNERTAQNAIAQKPQSLPSLSSAPQRQGSIQHQAQQSVKFQERSNSLQNQARPARNSLAQGNGLAEPLSALSYQENTFQRVDFIGRTSVSTMESPSHAPALATDPLPTPALAQPMSVPSNGSLSASFGPGTHPGKDALGAFHPSITPPPLLPPMYGSIPPLPPVISPMGATGIAPLAASDFDFDEKSPSPKPPTSSETASRTKAPLTNSSSSTISTPSVQHNSVSLEAYLPSYDSMSTDRRNSKHLAVASSLPLPPPFFYLYPSLPSSSLLIEQADNNGSSSKLQHQELKVPPPPPHFFMGHYISGANYGSASGESEATRSNPNLTNIESTEYQASRSASNLDIRETGVGPQTSTHRPTKSLSRRREVFNGRNTPISERARRALGGHSSRSQPQNQAPLQVLTPHRVLNGHSAGEENLESSEVSENEDAPVTPRASTFSNSKPDSGYSSKSRESFTDAQSRDSTHAMAHGAAVATEHSPADNTQPWSASKSHHMKDELAQLLRMQIKLLKLQREEFFTQELQHRRREREILEQLARGQEAINRVLIKRGAYFPDPMRTDEDIRETGKREGRGGLKHRRSTPAFVPSRSREGFDSASPLSTPVRRGRDLWPRDLAGEKKELEGEDGRENPQGIHSKKYRSMKAEELREVLRILRSRKDEDETEMGTETLEDELGAVGGETVGVDTRDEKETTYRISREHDEGDGEGEGEDEEEDEGEEDEDDEEDEDELVLAEIYDRYSLDDSRYNGFDDYLYYPEYYLPPHHLYYPPTPFARHYRYPRHRMPRGMNRIVRSPYIRRGRSRRRRFLDENAGYREEGGFEEKYTQVRKAVKNMRVDAREVTNGPAYRDDDGDKPNKHQNEEELRPSI